MDNLNGTHQEDFTASSLADKAGVHRSYISRLCQRGKIPAVKIAGTVWIIQHEDGISWLKEREERLAKRKRKET